MHDEAPLSAKVRSMVLGALALSLSACASGYSQFYQEVPRSGPANVLPFAGTPTILSGSGNRDADLDAAFAMGLAPVGVASFNGPNEGVEGAKTQAKKVGASHILVSAAYARTVSGAIPLTVPQTYTTQSSGMVTASGPRGYATGTYSGTSTTRGTSTTYIPYSVDQYDQEAIFLGAMERRGVGISYGVLNPQQSAEVGTNKALIVQAVRRGSPAFLADILPGDFVRMVNGAPVYDKDSFTAAVRFEVPMTIILSRSGKEVVKTITLGPGGVWQ